MKQLIETLEVMGTIESSRGPYEVCAAAAAHFDTQQHKVIVELEAFLRTTNLLAKEDHRTADWLPKALTISESVSEEEAADAARDIFHAWVKKVRTALHDAPPTTLLP